MRAKQVVITSPEYTLKALKNFPLKNLEKTFDVADFERPLRGRHVKKIVEAMVSNEFFDNILSVIQKRNGKYEIIDGQHREAALMELRDNHHVVKYDLMLMIFPEKYSRKIYRRINLGQPLRMQEHLRALDNDKHPFFTELRPYFIHYNDGRFPKFEMILNALSYAKNGSPRAIRALLLDRIFKNITEQDLKVIATFSRVIAKTDPFVPKTHQILYMHSIYRNMFRVGYENSFGKSEWEEFIAICKTDKTIEKIHNIRTMLAMRQTYNHMIKNITHQMGLNIQKVERTLSETKSALKENTSSFKSAGPLFFNN